MYLGLMQYFLIFMFITGLWNHVFLVSNLSLFIFLPFAYFFTEAEGFSGSRKVKPVFVSFFNIIEYLPQGNTVYIMLIIEQ